MSEPEPERGREGLRETIGSRRWALESLIDMRSVLMLIEVRSEDLDTESVPLERLE